jgi:hypothetical protein
MNLLVLLNQVAEETGIAFEVKPHPSSHILDIPEIKSLGKLIFIQKGKTLKQLLETEHYDFAITFNTVTYYECMYYGLFCLRYSVNENLAFIGLEDKFCDKETLFERINHYKNLNVNDLNNYLTKLLTQTLGMSLDYYGAQITNR